MPNDPESACDGKHRYLSKAEAKRMLRRNPAPRDDQGRKVMVYRCPYSPPHWPHWHLGHRQRDTYKHSWE